MGHIGLTLLVVSGVLLMMPYWKFLWDSPLLIVKLILVLVLGALVGIISSYAKKAAKGDTEKYLKKIKPFGILSLITGLAIVIIAVYFFH